jgi:hypothetical protein
MPRPKGWVFELVYVTLGMQHMNEYGNFAIPRAFSEREPEHIVNSFCLLSD